MLNICKNPKKRSIFPGNQLLLAEVVMAERNSLLSFLLLYLPQWGSLGMGQLSLEGYISSFETLPADNAQGVEAPPSPPLASILRRRGWRFYICSPE